MSKSRGRLSEGLSVTGLFFAGIDFFAWFFAVHLAILFRFEFDLSRIDWWTTTVAAGGLATAGLLLGFPLQLYRGRFVPGSLDEFRSLLLVSASVATSASFLVVAFGNSWGLPRSLTFIAFPIFVVIAGSIRTTIRFFSERTRRRLSSSATRVVIYGAGLAAESLIPQLLGTPEAAYVPVALLDDDVKKANRWISGVPMKGGWNQIERVAREDNVSAVVVAIPSASSELLRLVYQDCLRLGLKVIVLPSLNEYLAGERSSEDLRDITIEDFLGRKPLETSLDSVRTMIAGRSVLITGAGGSIGSELSSLIGLFEPSFLALLDRDETLLLECKEKVEETSPNVKCQTLLCDIRDEKAVSAQLRALRPSIVFHAAALKHVEILERFPDEAWKTNALGTWNVLKAARDTDVSIFVNISTDKAAEPANSLGKSKRAAEELTAWVGATVERSFVSVRFGNVLGSRGSLLSILRKQIERGGPVTVTHPQATRYFMSLKEACQLVLLAAAGGQPKEVMILDMGDPVKVIDVARRMIELSGRSVEVKLIGLREGEKLHEKLVSPGEAVLEGPHPKIMKVIVSPRGPDEILRS